MNRDAILQFSIILVLVMPVSAKVIHVPADYPDIRSAVSASNHGDEIILADGIYTGNRNCYIPINESITIRSENGPDNCIIDCNDSRPWPISAFKFRYPVTLEGLSIINGSTDHGGMGGAITCEDKLTAINCVFANNSSLYNGGAIYLRKESSASFMNCSLANNTAAW